MEEKLDKQNRIKRIKGLIKLSIQNREIHKIDQFKHLLKLAKKV